MGLRRNIANLKLQSLEGREVPSGNRLFAVSEDVGGGRVAVYEAAGATNLPSGLNYGPGDVTITGDPQFQGSGKLLVTFEPFPGFKGGVRVATGDVTGDGIDDLVVAAGKGGGPHVKVYDGANMLQGQPRVCGEFFAYDARFTGGVYVAIGQMDPQSPQLEIVVGAGEGGGPHVKVFELQEVIFTVTPGTPPPPTPYFFANMQTGFFAFDASFRGGVRVAAGDTTGDGKTELIAAAGPGGGPHVKVFDVNPPNPVALYPYIFAVVDEFYAFDIRFRGGVYVAAGELNGDAARSEVVVGAGEGGGPHVKVYGVVNNRLTVQGQGFVSNPDDRGGVRVGVGNLSKHTDRQSIYIGRGPQAVVTLAIPFADHRLASYTLGPNYLINESLYLPIAFDDHALRGIFVGV